MAGVAISTFRSSSWTLTDKFIFLFVLSTVVLAMVMVALVLLIYCVLPVIPAPQSGSLEVDQGDLCQHRHPVLILGHGP